MNVRMCIVEKTQKEESNSRLSLRSTTLERPQPRMSGSASSRRKKMAIILPKVSYEGVAKVGLFQANILKTHWHHDVEVISLIKEKQKFKELLDNLTVRYAFSIEVLSRILYDISVRFMKLESDLIIGHNIPGAVVSWRISEKNGSPYVAYIHDAEFKRIPGSLPSFGDDKIRKALSKAKRIFTNSMKTLEELKRDYKVDGVPLYPGCVPAELVNEKRSDFFLFVHFISPRGSFDFLAKLLKKEDFNLVIAGGRRWGWRKVLHSYEKFGDRVRFVFEPTERELFQLYQQAKGLIFPEMENFGLSPLEAAACGCPSMVAEGSGVLEILENGKEIMAFDEGNTAEFCEAIQLLKRDEQYARKLGKNAWKKAREYSWDMHVSKLAHDIETF